MSANHDHTIYLTLAGNEIAVDIGYDVLPGRPETGPSYDCGGEPALQSATADLPVHRLDFGRHHRGAPAGP